MVFYKFNIHTWINQHQKKTCGPLGQVIWSFYLAKTLVDISNQTQGLYYNIVHNVSTAIGSTTNKFAINGRRKPSTYGWFIFALLTLHILNVHVILLFPCRNVFFSTWLEGFEGANETQRWQWPGRRLGTRNSFPDRWRAWAQVQHLGCSGVYIAKFGHDHYHIPLFYSRAFKKYSMWLFDLPFWA